MSAHAEEALSVAVTVLRQAGCRGLVHAHQRSDWSVRIRQGRIERVESAVSSGIRVTAFAAGNRVASATTTDLSEASARQTALQAAELASWGDADPWMGLPPEAECGMAGSNLELDDLTYTDQDHYGLSQAAIEAEAAAFRVDPRITNSHRSGAHAARGTSWIATTDGLRAHRRGTHFGFHAHVVAQSHDGERQSGGWFSSSRHRAGLRSPAEVGQEAGERSIRRFGWRQHPSGPTPVVLQRQVASTLLGVVAQAVGGGVVYRGSSFLAGRLGQNIAAPQVTIIDNPLVPGALGTRPCDGEGVRSRNVVVVERGRLVSYLVDGYSARRIGHPYTGHDGGTSNLSLLPGEASVDDLLMQMGDGLLVTTFHGFGIDIAGGTISKGVSGFRIEGGRLTYPVQQVTIAAKLADILRGIRAVGMDSLEQSPVSSPSLLIDGFTVGGAERLP